MKNNKLTILLKNDWKKILFMTLGSLLMAISLSLFLVPNFILDGGITGVAIIISYLSSIHLSLLLVLLNLPFIYVGYKTVGKKFAFYTCYSILILSMSVKLLHSYPPLTNDLLLATFFGGIILGSGVGLVIKYGASLDGTEILSILLTRKITFSIGKIILFFNLFIYTFSGFIFGWDRAMYSMLCYIIASKTIDLVIYYFQNSKTIWIISEKSEEIGNSILVSLGKGVTYLNGEGAYSGKDKKIIFCVISSFDEGSLRKLVYELDKNAFITVADNSFVKGGLVRKELNVYH